jgi:signal transduction histidine kinase
MKKRVLLHMDHKENRRLLAEWLATRYLVIHDEADRALGEQYDLAMLDGTALTRLADVIEVRKKQEEPLFLPFVLVTGRRDVGLVTRHLWKSIDEVIHSPIDKVEVQARMEVLLRVRRQSVDLQDATRQRLAEHARHAAFLEAAPDAIITMDDSGKVVEFNPAAEAIFGYSRAVAVGRQMAELITFGSEVVGQRKDGSTFQMELAVSEFRVGARRYFTGIVRDITERKRLEQELRQRVQELAEADGRKDEFLAMLAHELRNPLAPICNGLHILKIPGTAAATIEHTRQVMELQVQHLVRLVDDLLDVARITRGKIALVKEPVDLAALFAQAVEMAQPALDAQGHKLSVFLPPEPLTLEGDLQRLAQVLGNLLNNAGKYTERAGLIWLTGELDGDRVVVRVRDNGIGIPAEQLPHIFDLFVQVDRSLERSQGGLGIGLTVARKLVEMHGGTITAHSAGPGMGSEFVVRLPALMARPAPAIGGRGGQPPTIALSRRVLVVDDNTAAADMLAMLLRLWGHEVRLAYNGPEALTTAAEYCPDLVLLDIGLPLMNGYEVARRLRREPALNKTVLVAVTGYGQAKDRRRSHDAGFDYHLTKPVDGDSLQVLVAGSTRAS